jgi:hypothetical protein
VAQGCLKINAQPVTWSYFFTLTSSLGIATLFADGFACDHGIESLGARFHQKSIDQ